MIPRILCRACGTEVGLHDKFCSNCGEKVELGETVPAASPSARKQPVSGGGTRRCPLCGHENVVHAVYCESCGAKLSVEPGNVKEPAGKSHKAGAEGSKALPLNTFKPWKVTAGLAILLIAVVIILKLSHTSESPPVSAPMSPNVAEVMKKIESLQKIVDANPKDADATLQLANLYHDTKSLSQSIVLYRRYLDMNPSNADARVDLGISYFQLSITDSTHRAEFLSQAQQEMEQALKYQPNHQLAHFNLGVVCLHTGDVEKAVEWFKKCIAIDPNSETGRRAEQLINQHSFNNPS